MSMSIIRFEYEDIGGDSILYGFNNSVMSKEDACKAIDEAYQKAIDEVYAKDGESHLDYAEGTATFELAKLGIVRLGDVVDYYSEVGGPDYSKYKG
jgi:hypothetical protein